MSRCIPVHDSGGFVFPSLICICNYDYQNRSREPKKVDASVDGGDKGTSSSGIGFQRH